MKQSGEELYFWPVFVVFVQTLSLVSPGCVHTTQITAMPYCLFSSLASDEIVPRIADSWFQSLPARRIFGSGGGRHQWTCGDVSSAVVTVCSEEVLNLDTEQSLCSHTENTDRISCINYSTFGVFLCMKTRRCFFHILFVFSVFLYED